MVSCGQLMRPLVAKLFFTTLCVCCVRRVSAIPLVHVAQIIMHKLENDLGNSVCYFCDQEIYHVLCIVEFIILCLHKSMFVC